MFTPSAVQLRDLIGDAITGDHLEIVQSEPGLAWMERELAEHLGTLDGLIAGRPSDERLNAARERVRHADVVHDDDHRFLHKLLDAGLHKGPLERRERIARALEALYANGLTPITASYRDEVAATRGFELRLEREDVQAGLDAAGSYAVDAHQAARDCVNSGEALGEALGALEALEAEQRAQPDERALFTARLAAHKSWSLFVAAVEHVFGGDTPDNAHKREALLGRWRGYQKQQPQGNARPAPVEPVEPTRTPTEPEPEPV